MKNPIVLIVATVFVFTLSLSMAAASYSTDATVTFNKDNNQYQVFARVCRLIEKDGELTEEVISQPRVVSSPGTPASLYVGPGRSDANYPNEENVTMDVSWPKQGEGGFANCTITVKLGDKIVTKSRMQVQVQEGEE